MPCRSNAVAVYSPTVMGLLLENQPLSGSYYLTKWPITLETTINFKRPYESTLK